MQNFISFTVSVLNLPCNSVFINNNCVNHYTKRHGCFICQHNRNFNFLLLLFFIDIPLLPSITSLSLSENEEKSGPFVVHWLNNKELHFSLSMEVFLQQLRKSFEQPSSEMSVEDSNQADVKSDEGKALRRIKIIKFYLKQQRFLYYGNTSYCQK